jgi:hypothetical protein
MKNILIIKQITQKYPFLILFDQMNILARQGLLKLNFFITN